MDQTAVRARYLALLGRLQLSADIHPFRTAPAHDGSAHVDFHPDGSADVIVTERGMTLRQERFTDPDDLLYRLMSDVAFEVACRRQRIDPPSDHAPARRIFVLQRSLLARLDPDWAARLDAEQLKRLSPDTGAAALAQKPLFKSSHLILPGLLLTLGCLLAALHVWGLYSWTIDSNLVRSGIAAEATVVSLEAHRTYREADIWRVRFRLAPESGHDDAIERRQSVDRRTFDRLSVGDRVTVRHPPGRPDLARLTDTDLVADRLFILLIIDLALGFAAFTVWSALVRAGREASG